MVLRGVRPYAAVRLDGRPLKILLVNPSNTMLEIMGGARVFVHSPSFDAALQRKPRFPDKSLAIPAGGCIAPMPGKVIELRVSEGDTVQAGQVLLIMEAMKMEHTVTAPHDGSVTTVSVAAGDQVDADALLAVVEQE